MSSLSLPDSVCSALERSLSWLGSSASSLGLWLLAHETGSLAAVRPWWRFFDLSAFHLASGGGWREYGRRLKSNAAYFRMNYAQVGLFAAAAGTVTQPMVLLGCAALAVVYFRLFGEAVAEVVEVCGVKLGCDEKVGVLVVLGTLVFVFAAGGLHVLQDVVVATLFVGLIHGCLRAVPVEAEIGV